MQNQQIHKSLDLLDTHKLRFIEKTRRTEMFKLRRNLSKFYDKHATKILLEIKSRMTEHKSRIELQHQDAENY